MWPCLRDTALSHPGGQESRRRLAERGVSSDVLAGPQSLLETSLGWRRSAASRPGVAARTDLTAAFGPETPRFRGPGRKPCRMQSLGVCVARGAQGGERCSRSPPRWSTSSGESFPLQDVPLWWGAKAYCVGEGEADRWPGTGSPPCSSYSTWVVRQCADLSLVTSLFPHSPMLSAPAAGPHARPGLPERRKPLLASQRGCGANQVLQEGPAATGPAYQPAASWRLTTSDSQWSNGGRRCSGPRPGWAQVLPACWEPWLSEPQAGCTFLLSGAILISRTGVERANLTGPSERS